MLEALRMDIGKLINSLVNISKSYIFDESNKNSWFGSFFVGSYLIYVLI